MLNLPKRVLRMAVVLLAGCTLLSGCGFRDIDKRFFVIEIGIDKGNQRAYKISLKLAIPSPRMEPGDSRWQIITAEGDSIAETVRRMKSMVDKEFDFGHAKVIVLGKAFAENGLPHSLDWMSRRRDIQGVAFMAIGEPDALTVLRVKPPSERLPGNALILSFTREGTESPYIVTTYWFDFYRKMRAEGRDPFLPVITAERDTFDIGKVAVFSKGNKKLELASTETDVFNQLVRHLQRFVIRGELKGKPFIVNVDSMKLKYRILTPAGGDPSIDMNIKIIGEVEESSISLFDQDWHSLERSLAENQRQRYTDVLKKLQEAKVDPVGFGLHYRATRHRPNTEWEEWQRLYPHIQFHVRVKVELKGTGIVK